MKKRVNDLAYGDKVFLVYEGNTEIKEEVFTNMKLDSSNHFCMHQNSNEFFAENGSNFFKYKGRYNNTYIFVNESDAIRYSKLQIFKKFNKIKEDAKKAFKEVRKFRELYWAELNTTHTEAFINELEKMENSI